MNDAPALIPYTAQMPDKQDPILAIDSADGSDGQTLRASGVWLVQAMAQKKVMQALQRSARSVKSLPAGSAVQWDLSQH